LQIFARLLRVNYFKLTLNNNSLVKLTIVTQWILNPLCLPISPLWHYQYLELIKTTSWL